MFKNQVVTVVGNAGRDAEMRVTPSGTDVTTVSVAVNCGYFGNDDKWIDRTMWAKGTIWGKAAERAANSIKKGNTIELRGELVFDPETGGPKVFDKRDGDKGAAFEIKVNEWRNFSKTGKGDQAESEGEPETAENDGDSFPL